MQKFSLILILAFLAGTLSASFDDKPAKEKELSYKSGKQEPRYMKRFRQQSLVLPEDFSDEVPGIAQGKAKILDILNRSAASAQNFGWFPKIEDECVVFVLVDLGNARFTLKVNEGEYEIKEGFNPEDKPNMIVPVLSHNLEDLAEILSDGEMTYEEQYRIFYFVTIPALQAIYSNEIFYGPGDKTAFKFDNLVHVVIPAEEDVFFTGVPRTIEATIVNVDGQWMVFRGLQGDPDFRISVTLDEAVKLYQLAFYEVRKIDSQQKAKTVSEEFLNFMDSIVVYTRSDHQTQAR